jgi:potassium-transporting ATPase KdpC subunit
MNRTSMRTDIVRSALVILVATVALGLVYPAVMVGISQLAFSNKADGSLITYQGRTVGSRLAGQQFTGLRYFHERPSATDPAYNAAGTTFANLGPNSKTLAANVRANVAAVLKLEGPYNPGLTAADIPVDAVTTSASGIDPDISEAYADLQAPRIAAVRKLPLATVHSLIDQHVDGRFLDFFGEPGVNVMELNLALDQEH